MKFWIARDMDGVLFLYDEIPEKDGEYFTPTGSRDIPLDDRMFPEITFENSPREIELKLV